MNGESNRIQEKQLLMLVVNGAEVNLSQAIAASARELDRSKHADACLDACKCTGNCC